MIPLCIARYVPRYLVGAAKPDVLAKHRPDRRVAYLDVYAHAAEPFHRWDGVDEWNKKTRVVDLGARDIGYQRQPSLIYKRVVFAAEIVTIRWVSARVLATGRGSYTGSVNASSIPHYLVVFAQPSEDFLVDALPNASFHPFVEPAPTSHATAAAELARQICPRYPGLEHKQNSG